MAKLENLDGMGPTPSSGGDKPQTQTATPFTKGQKATNNTGRYTAGKPSRGAGALGGKNR